MKLSQHFSLSEFTTSQTASRYGLDNTPGDAEIENLRQLCNHILEPIRAHFEVPIIISSGYRSPQVNTKVGGSSSSQHCKGEAADFTVAHYTVTEIFNWIAFTSGLEFDQLIHEYGNWIHCSYVTRRENRRSILRAYRNSSGRTVYEQVTAPL
ncbi:MAG: hypothetical protein H6702_17845 [Myxococcales bacterium]|nr:hypothetical protein [Myxococcales bacterium]